LPIARSAFCSGEKVRTKAIEAKLMPTRRATLLMAACSITACLGASCLTTAGLATSDDASARVFISAIYNSYTTGSKDGIRIDTGRKLRRYFEPALATAMDKDQEYAAKHREVGKLEWDPFIAAQDYEIQHVDVAVKDTAPGKATATVTFTNFGKPVTIALDLTAIKNDWRIYDITWPQEDGDPAAPATLRAVFGLKPAGAPSSAH
jgi:hypothetical protein